MPCRRQKNSLRYTASEPNLRTQKQNILISPQAFDPGHELIETQDGKSDGMVVVGNQLEAILQPSGIVEIVKLAA